METSKKCAMGNRCFWHGFAHPVNQLLVDREFNLMSLHIFTHVEMMMLRQVEHGQR